MKRSPLKSKSVLKAKQPLKAKDSGLTRRSSSMKSSKKHRRGAPLEEWSITELKKEATKHFNRAIKYRDSERVEDKWVFDCITCETPTLFCYIDDGVRRYMRTAHAGHFQPETKNNTRYNEQNVNGQCGSCNYNQGEQYKYAKALDLKYGGGTADELEALAQEKHPFTKEELIEIINEYKEQVRFYEEQA